MKNKTGKNNYLIKLSYINYYSKLRGVFKLSYFSFRKEVFVILAKSILLKIKDQQIHLSMVLFPFSFAK